MEPSSEILVAGSAAGAAGVRWSGLAIQPCVVGSTGAIYVNLLDRTDRSRRATAWPNYVSSSTLRCLENVPIKMATVKIFSALAVLAFGIAPARADKAVNFRCVDGKEFTAIFEDAGTLLIMIDGGAPRQAFGSPLAIASFTARTASLLYKMIGQKPRVCREAHD